MFGFGKRLYNNPTVPLPEALEWLGLPALPKAGQNDIIPVGKDGLKRGHFLKINVSYDNRLTMYVVRANDERSTAFGFDGAIAYGGDGPLQLRLDNLFMSGRSEAPPFYGDVRKFFEALRKGMQENIAPGMLPNYPQFESEKLRYARYAKPAPA